MANTNYCAHVIDDLSQQLRMNVPDAMYRKNAEKVIGLLKSSVKFRLPNHGVLMEGFRSRKVTIGESLDKYVPHFRLPYTAIALEYQNPFDEQEMLYDDPAAASEHIGQKYTATVIVLTEQEDDAGEWYVVGYPVFLCEIGPIKKWALSNYGFAVSKESHKAGPFPMTGQGLSLMGDPSIATQDTHGEMSAACEFLCAMSCSNAEPKDGPHPGEKLNKKREKRGKTPFFTYKELTIVANGPAPLDDQGGSHASPRVHLRRGHIRRLAHKTVWVNAAVVGDKSRGMVSKDYRVQP